MRTAILAQILAEGLRDAKLLSVQRLSGAQLPSNLAVPLLRGKSGNVLRASFTQGHRVDWGQLALPAMPVPPLPFAIPLARARGRARAGVNTKQGLSKVETIELGMIVF